MTINGGAVVAMRGRKCVAIASDLRFGVQAMTISKNFPKVFDLPYSRTMLGVAGLATDHKTQFDALRYHLNLHCLREERELLDPSEIAHMLSSMQYGHRFSPWFVEPVVAGLDSNNEPFVCSMDTIGCINAAEDFVVAGTASDQLYGMCESLYEPDLEPEELFEVIGQALLNACDRDALSGWGSIVHLMYYVYCLTCIEPRRALRPGL
jgi:20S proteasome subunit beta 3